MKIFSMTIFFFPMLGLRWEWLNSYTVFLKCEKIHISVEICGICENYLTEAFFLTDLTDGTDYSGASVEICGSCGNFLTEDVFISHGFNG